MLGVISLWIPFTDQTFLGDNLLQQFPSLGLSVGGASAVYFDNPAGTQVPQSVVDRMSDCLLAANANLFHRVHFFLQGRRGGQHLVQLFNALAAQADLRLLGVGIHRRLLLGVGIHRRLLLGVGIHRRLLRKRLLREGRRELFGADVAVVFRPHPTPGIVLTLRLRVYSEQPRESLFAKLLGTEPAAQPPP